MRIIAVDTADRRRITVVLVDGSGLRDAKVLSNVTVDRGLPPALAELDLEELTALVVVTGPGSHTGIRAGMAAVLGIAHACNLPLHSVGALEVVAHGAPRDAGVVHAVADAGRGGLFVGEFRRVADELVEVGGSRRVLAAGHRPPADAVTVALDHLPPGLDESVVVAASDAALAAAALVAVRRPALRPGDITSHAPAG